MKGLAFVVVAVLAAWWVFNIEVFIDREHRVIMVRDSRFPVKADWVTYEMALERQKMHDQLEQIRNEIRQFKKVIKDDVTVGVQQMEK